MATEQEILVARPPMPLPVESVPPPCVVIQDYPAVVRLNVNSTCNFRCSYPISGRPWCYLEDYKSRQRHPSIDTLCASASYFLRRFGIRHVKLGGVEPSLYPQLTHLVKALKFAGFDEVSMTTNGWNLQELAADLVVAGLSRVTVSIQSFDPALCARVTGSDKLAQVLEGVDAAMTVGLATKVNRVLLRESAHDLPAFVQWARTRHLTVRLYELMDLPEQEADRAQSWMSAIDVLQIVRADIRRVTGSFSRFANRFTWRYELVDGSAFELKQSLPKGESPCAPCWGCAYQSRCDTGYLGCGVRVMPDGGIRPCLLRDDLVIAPVADSDTIEGNWTAAIDGMMHGIRPESDRFGEDGVLSERRIALPILR